MSKVKLKFMIFYNHISQSVIFVDDATTYIIGTQLSTSSVSEVLLEYLPVMYFGQCTSPCSGGVLSRITVAATLLFLKPTWQESDQAIIQTN